MEKLKKYKLIISLIVISAIVLQSSTLVFGEESIFGNTIVTDSIKIDATQLVSNEVKDVLFESNPTENAFCEEDDIAEETTLIENGYENSIDNDDVNEYEEKNRGEVEIKDVVNTATVIGDKSITGLGLGAICNPGSGSDVWNYVYYGMYDSINPTKYRVLDIAATQYGGNTMLLDCDSILYAEKFDENSNDWKNSDVKNGLNGKSFLTKEGVFTEAEKAAIAPSTKSRAASEDGSGSDVLAFAPLTGEKIFLLDAKEVTRVSYGYSSNKSRIKKKEGKEWIWWIRSKSLLERTSDYGYSVDLHGQLDGWISTFVGVDYYGVSPAFNIDLSSVLFSSLISGTERSSGSEYKLTIKDNNMSITVMENSDIARNGNTITIPYTILGNNAENATQVSVLITDTPYTPGKSLKSGYEYLKLNVDLWGTSATGSFTLPEKYSDKICGSEYYAYILAEDVNDGYATDYASTPECINIPDPVAIPGLNYEITFDPNGGNITPTNRITGIDGKLVSMPTPTYAGHYFKGWYTEKIGGTRITKNTVFESDTRIYAQWYESNKKITGLGTGAISNPSSGTGGWNYVYYGLYDGIPVRYRVLTKYTKEFGGNTMLLDCDEVLYNAKFDEDGNANAGASKVNEWEYSDLKKGLNGDSFYTKEGVFTETERAAISSSKKTKVANEDGFGHADYSYTPLKGEKIFVLDSKEMTRSSYGYHQYTEKSKTRIKKTREETAGTSYWWLRSPHSEKYYLVDDVYNSEGSLSGFNVLFIKKGVSPAFNINLSSVIFSSKISEKNYKLTIKDDELKINTGTVKREDTLIEVQYSINGSHAKNATQISVLITDSPYIQGKAVTSGYTYYKINVDSWDTSGIGVFTLPDRYKEKECGTDFYVYIIAENVGEDNATDYASIPVSIMIPDSKNHIKGDVTGDGEVAMADVVKVARAVAGSIELSTDEKDIADVTGDGDVGMNDVIKLARYVAGSITKL